jgi:hypothetical protein
MVAAAASYLIHGLLSMITNVYDMLYAHADDASLQRAGMMETTMEKVGYVSLSASRISA